MVKFGSIYYLNLLPFQVFIKRYSSSQSLQMLRWNKGAPSAINREFKRGKIDAGFISSIASRNRECSNLGIVADGAVFSVLAIPGEFKADSESETSNALAKLLGIEGEILIGDKALIAYLNGLEALDLAKLWKERRNLPFVFARLCYNKRAKRRVKNLANRFNKFNSFKIPQYILDKASRERGISKKELLWYLEHINYKIGWQEEKSLKIFLKKSRNYVKNHPDTHF